MQRPDLLFQALKRKFHLILWDFFPPSFWCKENWLFVTYDVTRRWEDHPQRASIWSGSIKRWVAFSIQFSRFWDIFHFFFFPTANTRKMACGSGNVSNRPRGDCQKCNYPIGSKGKYSLKWHMLIVLNSKHLFGHPDVGKCHILISWNTLSSFRSSFLILIASRVSGKFFPTTVYWSHRSSISKSHLFPIRRNGKHNHKYLCKCHHVLLEALFRQLENYCNKFP